MEESIGHQQVIEWEYIDTLTAKGRGNSVPIVFYVNKLLNNDPSLNLLYKFEVIAYGFMCYYAAIGVKFISRDSIQLDEDFIEAKILDLIQNISLKDYIDFCIENNTLFIEFQEEVDRLTEELRIKYKEENERIDELRRRLGNQ